MRPPTSDEDRLAELRTEWQRHPDRRADIADEAARLKALHLITEAFPDAVVLETTEGSATP
ncbi:MAG TPA: hypothetical protein VHH34_24135 [Pseudonocardiaceae bacterium]|nr:hypothetical protein [Pseudonocardiaceae bacterium]